MTTKADTLDAELAAVKAIVESLRPLGDKARLFVLKTVMDRLEMVLELDQSGGGAGASAANAATATSENKTHLGQASSSKDPTPKEFMKAKRPLTDVQRIACLAYYLTTYRKQPTFKTKDLTDLNSEARGIRLSQPHVAVSNADRQNRFLTPAGDGRKQLTTHGEDVVGALPDQIAVKAIVKEGRKPYKKRSKKNAGK